MQRSLRGIMGSMKQDGLSMPQIYTLMYLYHEGEARISDIGVLMDVGKAAASQLVDRLVQQGLVERVEDESDRRRQKIRLPAEKPAADRKGPARAAPADGGTDEPAFARTDGDSAKGIHVFDRCHA